MLQRKQNNGTRVFLFRDKIEQLARKKKSRKFKNLQNDGIPNGDLLEMVALIISCYIALDSPPKDDLTCQDTMGIVGNSPS